ncbi:MAG: IS1634 family transposase, partial [Thermoplasmatota archaeon]
MTYTEDIRIRGHLYRYEVTGYRDPKTGKVRHRRKYLGPVDKLKSGELRLRPKQSRDPTVEQILPFGDLALLYDIAQQLEVAETIDRLVPRAGQTSAGKAVVLLAINHLVGQVALDDVAEWYEQTMLRHWLREDPEEYSEDRLFGVLDSICRKESDWMWDRTWFISDALRQNVEKLWGPEDRYAYYDRTQIVYHGETCYYAEFSHAHGESEDRRKIGMGMVVRRGDGFPVLYRVYRGNQVDVTTVREVKSRLKKAGLKSLILVMDRGMASDDNVNELVASGFDLVIGVRATENIFDEMVLSLTDDEIERPENRLKRDDRLFFLVERTREVDGKERKFVIYQDSRVRGEEKAGLIRALAEREERLREIASDMKKARKGRGKEPDWGKRVQEALAGLAKYVAWKIEGQALTWTVHEDKLKDAMARLGRCVIMTTAPELPKDEIVKAYLDKDEVEKVWRVGKGDLGLTGIHHRKRDRVQSYLLVCYVAYLLRAALRRRLKDQGIQLSPEKTLQALRRVEVVRFRTGGKETYSIPRPVGSGAKIYRAFKLDRLLPVALN